MAHALRYLIAALGVVVSLGAQQGVPAVRFTVFSARPIAGAAFVPRPGAAPQTLPFYPTARSPRFEYRGGMPLRFVDEAGAVIAEAQIPPATRDALLLFTPIEKAGRGPLRYEVAVIDDGAARHGPGSLAIVNLSGLALDGTIGEQSITLHAGLNPAITVRSPAKVSLGTLAGSRRRQAFAADVNLGRNQRALLLLLPPFYSGSVEVQSRLLVDYPPGHEPALSPAGKAPAKR